jgi:hypothetical protein
MARGVMATRRRVAMRWTALTSAVEAGSTTSGGSASKNVASRP